MSGNIQNFFTLSDKSITFKLFLFFSSLVRYGQEEKDNTYIARNPFPVLRIFGHMIKKLRVHLTMLNAKAYTELANYLAIYCSDSLEQLFMTCDASKYIFKDLKKPFEKVTRLEIDIKKRENTPYLRFLNAEILPNVNQMTIFMSTPSPDSSKTIHFENIEDFTIYSRSGIYPFSIGNVKHLTIAGNSKINSRLCQFISNVKGMKTLKIQINEWVVDSEWFAKILDLQNVLNVKEMQFQYSKGISSHDILQFLNKNRKLRKLTLHIDTTKYPSLERSQYEHYSIFLETISSNLGTEWKFHTKNMRFKDLNNIANMCYVAERTIKD